MYVLPRKTIIIYIAISQYHTWSPSECNSQYIYTFYKDENEDEQEGKNNNKDGNDDNDNYKNKDNSPPKKISIIIFFNLFF